MPTASSTEQAWQQRTDAKLAAAHRTLTAQIAALQSGEDWERFLDLQASLHSYSPNNVMLIAAQHAKAFAEGSVSVADPGYVAGFTTWKALGRRVDKGQHGYMVLAPCRSSRRFAVGHNGQVRPLAKGERSRDGEHVEAHRVITGFRVAHVFSVHQTSGPELPTPPRPQLLTGSAPPGLGAALVTMVEKLGFSVATVPDAAAIGGANGVTEFGAGRVLVRADMADAAVVKTLAHEAGHVLLHSSPPGQSLARPAKEVEAESVAYIVASVHGMDSGGYSFPYVSFWAGPDGARAVQAAQARVAQAARLIIDQSPAARVGGGAPPGAAELVSAARARRASDQLPGARGPKRDARAHRAVNDRQPSGGTDLVLGLAASAVGLGVAAVGGGIRVGVVVRTPPPAPQPRGWVPGVRPPGRPFGGLVGPGRATCALLGGKRRCPRPGSASSATAAGGCGAQRAPPDPPARARTGMATRREVKRAAGEKVLLARSGTLRPSLGRPRPADVGYQLGAARGVKCWASVEDSMLVLGPPRSGKGLHEVVRMVLDAPGAVVTTSTRPDNLAVTLAARARRGPVMVFDPQGLAGPNPASPGLRWSLTRGCEHPQAAMVRAEALVPDAGRSGRGERQLLARPGPVGHPVPVARRGPGRPAPADLFRWSHPPGRAKEAVTVLGTCPGATPGWDRALDAVISADERTRDSVWAMVANTFAPLADPAVLAAVTPEEGAELDPLAFLALEGTIYLLGTATGASATATLVAALIEDLVDAARRLAARCPGQRLDPPLALVLDEAPNYPLPSLPVPHVRRGRLRHHHGGRPPVAGPGPRPLGPGGGPGHLGLGHREGGPRWLGQRRRPG